VFFIWALVAAMVGLVAANTVASDAGWFAFLLLSLMFVAFSILGMANARPAAVRIRP
jgi:hypothetical protein